MTCREREKLLTNIPIIIAGSEKYGKCKTVDYLVSLLVYNQLPEVKKKINFKPLMKPLRKNGTPASKFRELTATELKLCIEESERVISAIRYIEQAAEHEESVRIRKTNEEREWKAQVVACDTIAIKKAEAIYRKGKFILYCKKVLAKIWYQDSYILQSLMYIAASFRLQNPDEGIHLHVAGDTQSGKSGSVKASLALIHPDDKVTRTFSPRWIFYADNEIHENMIIFSDDTVLDEDVAEVYRNVLTSWHEGVLHGTVINQEAKNLTIPRHVSLVLTSIESVCEKSADAQDESRFLTMEVHRSTDASRDIRKFVQETKPDVSQHIKVIHAVWSLIPKAAVVLHTTFNDEMPIREFKRYLTLIKCNALLNNRTATTDEDVKEVKEFLNYSKPLIDSKTAAYTRNERAVLDALNAVWQTPNDLKKLTGIPQASVFRALRGKAGTFERPEGGLLVKDKNLEMQYNATVRSHEFKH